MCLVCTFITARIRTMRESNVFSLFVHWQGGGAPASDPVFFPGEGTASGPRSFLEGTAASSPRSFMGYPGLDRGDPISQDTPCGHGRGTPPPTFPQRTATDASAAWEVWLLRYVRW